MAGRIPLLTLVVHVPNGEDRRIDITEWRTVIGRSSKNDIKIVGKQISKIHAAIEITDGVPFIRDLGSRNGVELNGIQISQPERLRAGDLVVIGDARITVDAGSLLFRPREAQAALEALLAEEAALRAAEEAEREHYRRSRESLTVNESFVPTRQSPHIVGRPVGNAAGERPVLRVLRIASDRGPYDVARIEAFLVELADGQVAWVKPNRNIDVAHLDAFPTAHDVWIDEPEDFDVPGSQAMIIARATYYLPRLIEVVGAAEAGRTPDGRRIFAEYNPDAPLVLAPAG